ncbi:MAG TPA: PAS domain S-box protein [Dehalococcoidia bacterium]|nr:PAS domain S-box protein [Dehalococcoidia bacterium]
MKETEPPHKELKALPSSGEIYGALVASSWDAILGVNRKGTIIFWNKGAEQTFGYSTDEILGQPVTKLMSEKHIEDHTKELTDFLGGNYGGTGIIEFEALRKDGSTFPVELSLSIGQQNGKFVGLAIGKDITERTQMEQALKESAERYCNLFANSLEAVFSADIEDNIVEGNKALEKLCDYCLEELTEMKPTNILSPENREYVSQQVEKMLSADEPISSIVHEIFRKDGKRILIEQYLNFIKRKDKIVGFQGSCRGITERNIAEEQLKSSFTNLAKTVSRVIESCDPYTAGHQQRVAELARLVGENMGLAEDMVEQLYLNGLLHDIGKISIPTSILTKPGELAEEEWALIRAHTKQGYSILKDANLPWPVADIALQHHERLDGSGYPNGITGDSLSLEVSILAVCDVVEAMSSHRPYRPARTTTDILKELKDGRGTKYNVSVVDVMLPMIESGEFKSIWNRRNSRSTATEGLCP